MAIRNPWKITYGTREIGGTSDNYLLHDPYVIERQFEALRLVFDIVVVASSYEELQTLSNDLEVDFRKRDQDLEIDLDGDVFSFTFGTDIYNTKATVTKSGNRETDRGFSRAYTVTVEGGLPADDNNGLREVQTTINYEPSRQQIVTFSGIYTPLAPETSARAQYEADFDTVATGLLAAIDATAAWELQEETAENDRNDQELTFSRQYLQLLADQTSGVRDDTTIKDHRVTFTKLSLHPGDSQEDLSRLRRVIGSYDCTIDIEQSTDLQATYEGKVRGYIREQFQQEYSPGVWCVEDERISYDETAKRMTIATQFLFQDPNGGNVVLVVQSFGFRETNTIDYTYVHNGRPLAAFADAGFQTLLRISRISRTVIGSTGNSPVIANTAVNSGTGWNLIASSSEVTPTWIGQPEDQKIRLTTFVGEYVEQYHEKPASSGGTTTTPRAPGGPTGPITQSGGNAAGGGGFSHLGKRRLPGTK